MMSKLTLISIAAALLASYTFAQPPIPDYYLIYGNLDGSTIDVYLDSDIAIEVWAATPDTDNYYFDCDCYGEFDSINFMHTPLASNDSVISSRIGGVFHNPLDSWDDVSFLPPDFNQPVSGFTSQSFLAFCDLSGPPNLPFFTNEDTVLIAEFFMHTTGDSSFLNASVCPFQEGFNPASGGLLWGILDGITPIIPVQTFSCLYFVDYLAGDANGSVNVNGLDVTYLVAYLKGYGPPPNPTLAGDANGDCLTNGMDVVYLVNYFRQTGDPPLLGDCH